MNEPQQAPARVTFRAFAFGLVICMIFAWYTAFRQNHIERAAEMTGSQIAVMPYMLMILMVVLLNPLLRLLRVVRPLTMAEVLIIFIMGSVSSGVSTYGLSSQLVPLISSLHNGHWNNEQSRWDIHVEPYMNERFFLSADGMQAAAIALRDVDVATREAKAIYTAAVNVETANSTQQKVQKAIAALRAEPESAERELRLQGLRRQEELANHAMEQARKNWQAYAEAHAADEILSTYPEKIKRLEEELRVRQQAHAELEKDVVAFIDDFRRGLPKDLRAVPGLVYTPGEGMAAYRGRLARMKHGLAALRELRAAAEALSVDPTAKPTEPVAAAIAHLDPIAVSPALAQRKQAIDDEIATKRTARDDIRVELIRLRSSRRYAAAEDFDAIDDEINVRVDTERKFSERITALTETLDREVTPELKTVERVAAMRAALEALNARWTGDDSGGEPFDSRAELQSLISQFNTIDASVHRFLVGDIQWRRWIKPIMNWLLIIFLTYLVLMTFNVLIFRQWAHNEKLVYPLAELPTMLCGGADADGGGLPPIFRSGLFWVGFSISGGVLGWNILSQDIPGINPIQVVNNLGVNWGGWIANSPFEGLQPHAKFHVFFTLVGLTFLVPSKISHSLWFFHFVYWGLLLILVWLGHGVNSASFPMGWWTVLSFRSATGGGALMVFSTVLFWKCRAYIFSGFAPAGLAGLDPDERAELRLSSWLFVGGSVALIVLFTTHLGTSIFYAIFFYLVILMLTIALIRAVAEGGLLSFQCFFGPFHLVRSFFGLTYKWTGPALLMPLIIYYSLLFLDIKTFIAPAMANALKIRDTVRMQRFRFHLAVFGGIAVALVVGLGSHIIIGYHQGADSMSHWFYYNFPRFTFNDIKTMAVTNPIDTVGGKWWLMTGALVMGALLYMRRHLFWLPHPIGLIMLVNPLMGSYWFSIFLGWLFKTTVSKYGNKDTYARMRYLFIGLIVGELVMCLFGADLNRGW